MKEIIFSDKVLQKENRVKLPDPIVDSLNIKEGDSLTIILDTEEECIKIMKVKKKK
jgi:bifunctional DNA-binding transcriptional regulator/antitoxin component of YhaV-PrlF toxin-antitoxin module